MVSDQRRRQRGRNGDGVHVWRFQQTGVPRETRLIGTSEGCGDFTTPNREEDAITSGRNYKLLDEKGEVIDETGVVPEATDATHTWQRMKVWDGEPKAKFKVTEFSDSFDFTRDSGTIFSKYHRVERIFQPSERWILWRKR